MSLFAQKTVSSIGDLIEALHQIEEAAPVVPGGMVVPVPLVPAEGGGRVTDRATAIAADATHTIPAGDPGGSAIATRAIGALRWFRGHADSSWRLVPSIGRPPYRVDQELALIKRFKQDAYSLVPHPPENDWHWLFLMQHHGMPTRLLDWSENPLVALYFAVADETKHGVDGDVWCLDPIALNTAAHIQSTVSGELPFFGIDEDLAPYNTEGLLIPRNKPPVAALAQRYFPRLVAQAGVFTITQREQTPLEDLNVGAHVGRLSIPSGAKRSLRKDLAALGITRLTLFPDLDSVALHAKGLLK